MDEGESLIQEANRARERAYAPYSGYRVGAAVRDERGRVWTGCNVENASYGLSICAERAAVFAMIAGGGAHVRALALVTEDLGTPCGACRQVLAEFCEDPDSVVVLCARTGEHASQKRYTLADLLPYAFRFSESGRTERGANAV